MLCYNEGECIFLYKEITDFRRISRDLRIDRQEENIMI